jgi:hypothetical protein
MNYKVSFKFKVPIHRESFKIMSVDSLKIKIPTNVMLQASSCHKDKLEQ